MGYPEVRRGSALLRLAVAGAALAALRCSLLAPSDAELTGGGNGQDAGGLDGTIPSEASTSDARRFDGSCVGCTDAGSDAPIGCNGVIDCSQPQCSAGYACVPSPPSEWQWVAFSPTSTGDCLFGGQYNVQVATPDGPDPCGCTCSVQGTSCDQGEFTVLTGSGGTCTATTATLSPQTTCAGVPGNPTIAANSFLEVEAPASPTGCGATPQPGFSQVTNGLGCTMQPSGQGCASGQECDPVPPPPAQGCLMSAGQQVCPPGFTKTYYTGSSVQDGRQCGACACGVVPCAGNVSLWAKGNCHGTPDVQVAASGTCAALNNALAIAPNGYQAVVTDGGCGVTVSSQPVPDAGLVWTGEETVCCP